MNITYRFKFSKGEGVKFIGHLDVLKAFQRALKRADLPIAYSQGFYNMFFSFLAISNKDSNKTTFFYATFLF